MLILVEPMYWSHATKSGHAHYLLGREGDCIHAILLGAGFNIRKLLRVFSWLFYRYFYLADFSSQNKLKKAEAL